MHHKHSENCIFCNILKVAETIEQKLDKLQSDIEQTKNKISEIKKQNDETVKKMTEILEKIGYKILKGDGFQTNKIYFIHPERSHPLSDNISLEFAYFFDNNPIHGLPDGKNMAKIEKELFNKGLDEEFTLLEAQLNKQFKNAKDLQFKIINKIPDKLVDILSEKFPKIRSEGYSVHGGALISDYYEHFSINLSKDIKQQALNLIKNYIISDEEKFDDLYPTMSH